MLGRQNPIRYRGYEYDEESGLYYLRSRYYNPDTGRFISADSVMGKVGEVLSHNLYCYCGNNPIVYKDINGYSFFSMLGLDECQNMVENYGNAINIICNDIKQTTSCIEAEMGMGLATGGGVTITCGTKCGFEAYAGLDLINLRVSDNTIKTGYAYVFDSTVTSTYNMLSFSGRVYGYGCKTVEYDSSITYGINSGYYTSNLSPISIDANKQETDFTIGFGISKSVLSILGCHLSLAFNVSKFERTGIIDRINNAVSILRKKG